jgi:hypothetical protein
MEHSGVSGLLIAAVEHQNQLRKNRPPPSQFHPDPECNLSVHPATIQQQDV